MPILSYDYDEEMNQKKQDVKSCVKVGAAFSLLLYLSLKYEYYIPAAFSAFMVAFMSVVFKNELSNLADLRKEGAQRPMQKRADEKQHMPKVPDAQALHPLQERKFGSWHYGTRKRMVTFVEESNPQYRSKSADALMSMQRTNPGLGSL